MVRYLGSPWNSYKNYEAQMCLGTMDRSIATGSITIGSVAPTELHNPGYTRSYVFGIFYEAIQAQSEYGKLRESHTRVQEYSMLRVNRTMFINSIGSLPHPT